MKNEKLRDQAEIDRLTKLVVKLNHQRELDLKYIAELEKENKLAHELIHVLKENVAA